MGVVPVRAADEIERMVQQYSDMLFRICLITLGSEADAEDAVQETFLKYLRKAPLFETSDHEKAWLIHVAVNQCRDMQRFHMRHPQVNLDEIRHFTSEPEELGILDALMALPDKFRIVMLLHYVEEYRTEEIAKIIGKTSSAVKMRLQKGRKLLEEQYRKESRQK